MTCLNREIGLLVVNFLAVFASFVWGLTDPRDVYAITQFYTFLDAPPLPGWIPGGDPCGPPSWVGVECVNQNVTALKLPGSNLAGVLTDDLESFASIISIDLSNNHIGGDIPSKLPITLRSLFLSNNQFTGRIPTTLSSLGQLTDLSLDGNQLNGPMPDAFQPLTALNNADFSNNNLTGALSSSMGNMSALTKLHLQNNHLIGVLDVLQDLPLTDLNVENNLFSGPIPPKLLSIPNFRRDKNPFNTTILPTPPAPSPLSPFGAPLPQSGGDVPLPPAPPKPQLGENMGKKGVANKVLWIALGGVLVAVIIVLLLCLRVHGVFRETVLGGKNLRQGLATHDLLPKPIPPSQDQYSQNPLFRAKKASEKVDVEPNSGGGSQKKTAVDSTGMAAADPQTMPRFLPLIPSERIVANPTFSPLISTMIITSKTVETSQFFSIASLQQYTSSFSQENLIGKGLLGSVYTAQLPDGKVLAIKKLDNAASGHLTDQEFLDLVSRVSRFQHKNILKLEGYCLEHGQRLLVYSYCRNGTLDDALNLEDGVYKKLSWNVRMHLALQAAKALEYLHEGCQPPIVHKNFKPSNVLLEDDLTVQISDCGLAPLLPPYAMAQLQSSGYGAPELEHGSYSLQSDVYSFGVIMLQLITGRKSFDRSRPRGEQNLARWAFLRLHDIDTLSRMVDPSLNGAYPSKSLSRVADIISLCIQPEPEFRPPMSEIVQKLLQMIDRDS